MMNFIEDFSDYHMSGDLDDGRPPKDEFDVKWQGQKYFEYFDELTKPAVFRTLESDSEFRARVFERLFNDDFLSFKWVRSLPAIAANLKARQEFMGRDEGSSPVKNAVQRVEVFEKTKDALNVNERVAGLLRLLTNLTTPDIDRLELETIEQLRDLSAKLAEMANALKNANAKAKA